MSMAPELQASVNSPVVAFTMYSTGTPSDFASAAPISRGTPRTSPAASLVTKTGVGLGAYAIPTRKVPVGTNCFKTLSSTPASALADHARNTAAKVTALIGAPLSGLTFDHSPGFA